MESFFKWNTIYRLIAVEVVVFLAINLLVLLVPGIDFDTFFRDGFPLAAKASGMELIKRPWTILTHLFVHNGFAHILWNMIILAIAGNIFVRYLGNKKSLSVFLFSGVFALLVVTLIGTFNTKVDVLQPYLGSSAAVLGVLIASATYAPNHPMTLFLVGKVKYWIVAGILVLYYVVRLNQNFGFTGDVAHVSGAAFGFIYAKQLQSGKNILSWFESLIDRLVNSFKSSGNKMKVVHRQPKNTERRYKTDEEYALEKKRKQQRLDGILDKISKSGYDSLNQEEKDFLFQQSQQ